MANRSFIYTTDNYQQTTVDSLGLSEYQNEVHPLYLLMVAGESQIIFSNLVDETEKTAIAGNFDDGKDLALKFLELVLTYEENYQTDLFREFVTETKIFLNQRHEKYIVLETFEIVDLNGNNFIPEIFRGLDEIKRQVEKLYEEHLSGNLTSDEFRGSAFYNDFDDTSIEWGEIDHEDIEWTDFWSENLYFES